MNADEVLEIEQNLRLLGWIYDGGNAVTRREIAEEWAEEEFTPDEVWSWTEKAGCWDTHAACVLRDAGFRPGVDQLAYRPGEEREDMDAMYALCNRDVSLAEVMFGE